MGGGLYYSIPPDPSAESVPPPDPAAQVENLGFRRRLLRFAAAGFLFLAGFSWLYLRFVQCGDLGAQPYCAPIQDLVLLVMLPAGQLLWGASSVLSRRLHRLDPKRALRDLEASWAAGALFLGVGGMLFVTLLGQNFGSRCCSWNELVPEVLGVAGFVAALLGALLLATLPRGPFKGAPRRSRAKRLQDWVVVVSIPLAIVIVGVFAQAAWLSSLYGWPAACEAGRAYPSGMALDASDQRLFVTEWGKEQVSAINLSTDRVETTWGVGCLPSSAVLDPQSHLLFVANIGGQNLTVINVSTQTVVATPTTAYELESPVYDPSDHTIYAGSRGQGVLIAIDPQTFLSSEFGSTNGYGPSFGLAYDPANHQIYATGSSCASSGTPGTVTALTTPGGLATANVSVGPHARGLTFDPLTGDLYSADAGGNDIAVIDPATEQVIHWFAAGAWPRAIAVDTSNGELYVANYGSAPDGGCGFASGSSTPGGGSISVLNATTGATITTIPDGGAPVDLVYDPITQDVYVSNVGADSISVVSTSIHQIVGTIPVG